MSFPGKILLLEDTPSDAELIIRRLKKGGASHVHWVEDSDAFMQSLNDHYDVIISDYNLPGFKGINALQIARERDPFVAFIICSGIVGDERAADVIKGGADDFVSKDNIFDRLNISVERAYDNSVVRRNEHSTRQLLTDYTNRLTSIVNNIQESILLLEGSDGADTESEVLLRRINPSFIELMAQFNPKIKLLPENPNVPFFELLNDSLHLDAGRIQLWRQAIFNTMSRGVNHLLKENIILEDGRRYILEINITPIMSEALGAKQCLGIIRDITRKVQTEEFILSSIIQAQEKERMRMANELHDSVGQCLSAAVLNLNILKSRELSLTETGCHKIDDILSQVNTAIQEARNIAHNLIPKAIEDFGLEAAIGSMLDTIAGLDKVKVNFNSNLENQRFDSEIEINLFRVCQESMNNVLKHSKAERVNVQLVKYADALIMTIEDDGIGFNRQEQRPDRTGIGLNGMINRVRSMGGEIEISSVPGKGTQLLIELPLIHIRHEKPEHSIG